MKRLIIYFLILLLSVWIGIKIHANPGYVLISYQHWSIETSLWAAILILIVFLIVIYFLYRIIHGFLGLTGRFHRWTDWRRLRKARKFTSRGLCELAEGNWKKSEKLLTYGAAFSETPLINYLAAARAAQGLAAYERRDEYLGKAHDCTKGSEQIAVGLTQAQLQLSSKQLELALATLRHLNQLVPHHPYVLKLLQGVYFELNDWEQLRVLLPELRKYNVLTAEQLDTLELKIYLSLLNNAQKTHQDHSVTQLWETVPKHLRKEHDLLMSYTGYLIQHDMSEQAEEILREALKRAWYPDLVYQYGTIISLDQTKQLSQAESWLKHHEDDPILLLTLGRISARNLLWANARDYLERSLKLEARVETYRELGNVLEELGDKKAAFDIYRSGLMIAKS